MKFLRRLGSLFIILTLFYSAAHAAGEHKPELFNYAKAYFYNFYSVYPQKDGQVWIVGSGGVVCKLDKKLKKWVVLNAGVDATLYSVSFPDNDNGWIAGQNGLILHTSDGGKTWTRQDSRTTEHLFSIYFTDKDTGWVAGAYGSIFHTADGGATWVRQDKKIDKIYNDVFFTDKNHGWVVGEFGSILHTADGGASWKVQENPLGEKTMFSVFFKDDLRGWITGMDGAILQTTDGGENWSVVKTAIKEHLFSIQVIGDTGWTVGLKGEYGKFSNGKWHEATAKMPTKAWLKQCAFLNDKIGWIVGSVGTVLYTDDAGETWRRPWNMKTLLPADNK